MPIYEYECGQCSHRLESFEKMTDTPLTECPVCGKPALQKLVSAAGFQLKGTGWYVTDFRNKDKPPKDTSKEDSGNTQSPTEVAPTNAAAPKENKTSTDSKIKDTTAT